jgi:pimeloyl-ACP methyl ester carboxylesterase
VLFHHGTPGSRLIGRSLHEQAAAAGARVIAVERPGYGLSDYWRAPTVASWSTAAVRLLDELEIERLPVLGVSGGGPYALAFGALLGNRVSAVGVISGACAVEDACGLHGFSKWLVSVGRLSRRFPARPLALLTRELRRHPDRIAAHLSAELARQGVEHPWAGRLLLNDFVEAFAVGSRGLAGDIARLGRWGFMPEDVAAPVVLWHGEQDAEIAVDAARRLAGRLPDCRPTFVPAEGHLGLLPRHGGAVVAELLRLARADEQPGGIEQPEHRRRVA